MAANSATSTAAETSYPSPAPAGLPFYQHPLGRLPHGHTDDHDNENNNQQHNGSAQGPDEHDPEDGEEEHEDDSLLPIPDDPTLRANLADMMGTFDGSFGGVQAGGQMAGARSSIVPTTSATFSQASGLSDTAPSSSLRQKERSKVSRACDECRRKKIRCDAVDETTTTPCTNCSRTSAKCTFSRQPMKRGPSKGYIKELAERLNSLEQQVHPPHLVQQARSEIQHIQQQMAGGLQSNGRDLQILNVDPRVGDKRTHDTAEGFQTSPTQTPGAMVAHMNQYARQRTSLAGPSTGYRQPFNQAQPFWSQTGAIPRPEPMGAVYDVDAGTTIINFDWDEQVVDEYYRIIHQTFPLLPNNKNRLRQRLADCPSSLREAFLVAIDCLMRTFPTTSLPPNAGYAQALKRAAELLAKYPFDNPSSHTDATNLVYLQTLLLMALESDNHGPATIRGQAGPSRAEWLGRAAGVAGQLEINVIRTPSQSVMDGDRDSEERLARRVWWVLFILDRWHASSTADLLKLPENSVVLLPEDQILLGESTYHLARLSFIIGHLAAILTTTKTPSTDVMAPSNPASSLIGLTLAGEIDRFRESVESVWGSLNLVHLSYHHCHLLIKRLSPTTEPTELVGHAVKVATVLNSRLTPVTPLNHHFGALAAMTLCELCDVPKTRTEAMKGLEHLVACLGEGRGLAGKQESEGWDGAIRELVVKKHQRLMANGDQASGSNSDGAYDPTGLTRYGYLTALGQGRFITK
ncbi:Hypothetical protein R9X50_00389900 [Acrodontium crateriforme]|uniref:Zn(2)-C6 fungal-type domain-containing protein n=1 Tax=Acrodontium crateriforme TaxID=150365 RepID=A0AAQ3R7V6_9PEZI|nr:Hypothetical protein R9X50_00389900 [Acrodontium crateriforme]